MPLGLSRSWYGWHLVEERTRKIVNVGNWKLRPTWLRTVRVRGVCYHKPDAKAAELFAGSPLRLTREPDNPHESRVVAVSGTNAPGIIGYVNKQMTSGLAKLLDAGTIIEGMSLRGSSAGDRQDGTVKSVAGIPGVMAWIQRR